MSADRTSYAYCYNVNGYQTGVGVWNPMDVICYYISREPTRDWSNGILPLTTTDPATLPPGIFSTTAMMSSASLVNGSEWQWAQDRAVDWTITMQLLSDRHGRPWREDHPQYTQNQLVNFLSPTFLSLCIDTSQCPLEQEPGGLHPNGGPLYRLLHGENAPVWRLYRQVDPHPLPAEWPPSTGPRGESGHSGLNE